MKKSILSIGKILLPTLLVLVFSIVTLLPIPVVTEMNPKTTIYLDLPTINGTAIGVNNTVTVNLTIRDAPNMNGWEAGMIFNATLLNCTGFEQGEFLSNVGPTLWQRAPINNTSGEIGRHACILTAPGVYAHDDGRLAYLTFKVKLPGLSDLHLRDVGAGRDTVKVPINIIDVYTAVVDTLPHTVVTVSNSTDKTGWYGSGFYAHAFSLPDKEISVNVTGPKPGFSNVTIPKALLNVSALDEWKVMRDNRWLDIEERTITENLTHTSIYFTYTNGIHEIRITTRQLMSSTISMVLNTTTINLGSTVTVSGNVTADDPVDSRRPDATVAIQYRLSGIVTWTTLVEVTTDENSHYSQMWMPDTNETFEVRAKWYGDPNTWLANSDVQVLTVYWAPPTTYGFEVVWEDEEFSVIIESYSEVSDFNFIQTMKEICFNVTGPPGSIGACNVTIPKTLLWGGFSVSVNGEPPIDLITSFNATHNSLYFTFKFQSTSKVQIRGVNVILASSTISITFSPTTITLGENVTISGAIDPLRAHALVAIQNRTSGAIDWTILGAVNSTANGNYNYTWTPETTGTFEIRAQWYGDELTENATSDVMTLTVEKAPAGIPMEIVIVAVVAIVVVAAVVVYFVKFRKP